MTLGKAELQPLLSFLGIEEENWNLLLFGDGSGSRQDWPGGWACFAIEQILNPLDKRLKYHKPVYGAVSAGPINWMECLPYWHFIRHYHYYLGGKDLCQNGKVIVHVATDSEWTAQAMSGQVRVKVHRDMVTLYETLRAWGYHIRWHHVGRETLLLQSLADRLSAQAREYLSAVEPPPEFDDLKES